MAFYSLVAFAKHPVSIPDPLIMLGEGPNVFTAATDDIEALLLLLREEGADVQQVNRLDGLDPVPSGTLLLPDEGPEALTPLLDE